MIPKNHDHQEDLTGVATEEVQIESRAFAKQVGDNQFRKVMPRLKSRGITAKDLAQNTPRLESLGVFWAIQ